MMKKVLPVIAMVIALFVFFGGGLALGLGLATTRNETETETETEKTTAIATVVEKESTYYHVDWDLPDSELQKKFLEDFDEGDEEKALSENSLLVRVGRCFRVEHLKPNYTIDFVGSVDVPAEQLGWGYNYENKCAPAKGCTYVVNEGKLQSWTELVLNWEVEIPDAAEKVVEIHSVQNGIVVLHNKNNNTIYLVYDSIVRELATNVVDFVANHHSIWWLNTDGEVYKLQDYIHNPAGEAKLLATDVIALSPSTSDAPGWFVEGECNPEYIWVAQINGEFVPMK